MNHSPQSSTGGAAPRCAQIIPLRPPRQWHDPLGLIQSREPGAPGRVVLWSVSILVLALIAWAAIGKLDIIASAEGKLAPQTLLKIVQPAEAGVVRQLLVGEGDSVTAGQVLARLDTTLASADRSGVRSDLAIQQMQARRIEAELGNRPMLARPGDDRQVYAQVAQQFAAHRKAYLDGIEQERSLLAKVGHEKRGAQETLAKLEQTLPIYREAADNLAGLARDGYVPASRSEDKRRETIEKEKDIDAQKSMIAALSASVAAQGQRLGQLRSAYKSELEKELAEVRARIGQLQPTLDKSVYKEGQMELRAPQDGVVKDLATTTVGAVVQPGSVVLTLVPKGEQLFADVSVKNADVGFVQVGQRAQVKLAAYPFQRHGMLSGKVIHVSADATEAGRAGQNGAAAANSAALADGGAGTASYKARVQLDQQALIDPQGNRLRLTPGMQVVVEINQGRRTVLEYLLSPVQKAVSEAARER
ncbi:MAG: HlyD family type I secretion periplasmic adaptor subunit [Burkholderiaceae bacterium]|nr:HlyD family type I secretion periplasmic adaptor subunit [Burkholderiaceae bacterium]